MRTGDFYLIIIMLIMLITAIIAIYLYRYDIIKIAKAVINRKPNINTACADFKQYSFSPKAISRYTKQAIESSKDNSPISEKPYNTFMRQGRDLLEKENFKLNDDILSLKEDI